MFTGIALNGRTSYEEDHHNGWGAEWIFSLNYSARKSTFFLELAKLGGLSLRSPNRRGLQSRSKLRQTEHRCSLGFFESAINSGNVSEQARFVWPGGWQGGADLVIGGGHRGAATRSAHQESLHDEEGLVDFLDGGGVLTDGDGE